MKQKLVSLLFALAFAQYAPAQGATSVDLVGVGGAFALPIYTKWFAEYGTSNGGVQFHHLPRGSAEGNSNVSSGSTDFGGSEVPLNVEELAKVPTKLLLLPSAQTTRGTQKRGIGHRRKTVIATGWSEENENTFG